MKTAIFVILACLSLTTSIQALDNGVALTPPMGWMSWQRFRCVIDCDLYPDDCISDRLMREMADLMVSEGYLEAGYEYLIIDDCWLADERDENGKLQPDPVRFPYGMKSLADYVHNKGLKFGLYEDIGTHTCVGYPGIMGHLEVDAKTFAEWEVDYIKIDGCYAKIWDYEQGYTDFGRYLNETGRPIVYSCSWPGYIEAEGIHANYTYLAQICNLWRNWGDIQDSYSRFTTLTDWFARNQERFINEAGPGQWNDPDMLLVGNYALSYDQSKSQMAIWSIMASPLLMSVDLRNIHPKFKELLLHKEVIAINQDKLSLQGRFVKRKYNIQVWTKPLSPENGSSSYSYAVALQSRREDGTPFLLKISLEECGLTNPNGYVIRDVFEPFGDVYVATHEKFEVEINPSGVVLLRATPVA